MGQILVDPNVTVTSALGQISIDGPSSDLIIESSTATSTSNAILEVSSSVPAQWTLQVRLRFDDLPFDFSDLVNSHIFFGTTNDAGLCAGLFFADGAALYAGAIHHVAGNMVLDSTTQVLPLPSGLIAAGVDLTVRLVAAPDVNAIYIFITPTADVSTTGHILRAIVPGINYDDLAYPPIDNTVVSVRGTNLRPSKIAVDTLCLSSKILMPNLAPKAFAGEDQAARFCSIIRLDGSESFDPEGAPLDYTWRLIEAPEASEFVETGNDGFTITFVGGFTYLFYAPDMGAVDTLDPFLPDDVLIIDGEPRSILNTGTDINGFFFQFAATDIPDNLSGVAYKVIRQRGVSDADTANPTFFPDAPGFYQFDLKVSDGQLFSNVSKVLINVLETLLPRNCTPDVGFVFRFLSDFWSLVEDKEQIPVFWSGVAQVAASELYTLWQYEYSKSLRDVQRDFVRRWLHYDLLLAEPIPELSKTRAVWGGVEIGPIPAVGLAGFSGATLDVSSPRFAEAVTVTFKGSDPFVAATIQQQLSVQLSQADSRFVISRYTDQSTTDEYVRINAPFAFTLEDTSTIPPATFTAGAQNRHPFATTGGAGVGPKTYKASKSLKELDIKSNDFLCLAGVAYRIDKVIDDTGDAFPFQRVVLRDPLPTAPSGAWDIAGYVTSELLDFYAGLVTVGDRVFFEIAGTDTSLASTSSTSELVETAVLGVNQSIPDALPFDPLPLGSWLAEENVRVNLAKVLRRGYVPIDKLVTDIPILSEKIVIGTQAEEQAALRRNVDFFLEEHRGQAAVRFVSGKAGEPGDVWEGENPPNRLWAEITYIDNNPLIEEHFGIPAEFTLDDLGSLDTNLDYLSAVRGLWYAYFKGPTLSSLRIGAQILLGLPFAEQAGTIEEIRTDFSPRRGRILIRDTGNDAIVRSYAYPKVLDLEINPATGAPYAEGDTVTQFAPLVRGAEVVDFVKDPTWYEGLLNQGIFFEVEKFFKFLVRVDSAAFNLSTLLFVRRFILRVKPTYTYPVLLVQFLVEREGTDIDVTDTILYPTTLYLNEQVCGAAWLGSSTIYDEGRSAGGGIRNQFDSDVDPNNPAPTPTTPDGSILWGYDKNYLCPGDVLSQKCCITFGAPTVITFDACFAYDTPVEQTYNFLDSGPFNIAAGPVGTSLTPTTGTTANFTSNITQVQIRVIGDPTGSGPGFEVAVDVNAAEQNSTAFVKIQGGLSVIDTPTIAVTAGDAVTARIRPQVGGTITTVPVANLVDGETFTLDDGTNPASVFEFDILGDGVSVGNIPVVLSVVASADEVRDAIINAINAAPLLSITAYNQAAALVGLVHDGGSGGTAVAITDTVVDVGFVVTGMTAGPAAPNWSSLRVSVQQPDVALWAYGDTLPAGTYCSGGQVISQAAP